MDNVCDSKTTVTICNWKLVTGVYHAKETSDYYSAAYVMHMEVEVLHVSNLIRVPISISSIASSE